MKIQRTTANKILTRMIGSREDCFIGLLNADEELLSIDSAEHLKQLLEENSDTTVVFNQHTHATDCIDQLEWKDGQYSIEIFLDTEGVFGLRGYRMNGKIQTPELLELAN